MALLSNLLYPPLVDSAMDSFLRSEACKVYFNLNDYNSVDEIRSVQVVVYQQNNSQYALTTEFYPAHIMEVGLNVTDDESKGEYFIEIDPGDVGLPITYDEDGNGIGGGFPIDLYYKVQLRFVNSACTEYPSSAQPLPLTKYKEGEEYRVGKIKKVAKVTEDYLIRNKNYFSEWSTLCLFRGINSPSLTIQGQSKAVAGNNKIAYHQTVVDVFGELTWIDPITNKEDEDNWNYETLQMYRIKVYNSTGSVQTLLVDSNWKYPTIEDKSKHQLYYNIPYNFVREQTYYITIDMVTSYGYQAPTIQLEKFQILPVEIEEDLNDYTFSAVANNEEGYVHLKIKGHFNGNLCIRRASSENQFTSWEDLKYINSANINNEINYEFNDITVKSGVFYRYGIQRITYNKQRGDLQEIGLDENSLLNIMPDFEYAYLSTSTQQLKIKYDKNISGLKHVVKESATETLGSKYPFIRRNANVDYKQFQITGLISYQSDEKHLLISKNDLLRDTRTTLIKTQTNLGNPYETSMNAEGSINTIDSLTPDGIEDIYNTNSIYGQYEYPMSTSTLQEMKRRIAKSYEQYNHNHRISELYDYNLERDFREAVMNFLYEDTVKLFKSASEGNMLVKLTDISLEPKETLNGLVYSFTATANEIAEYNLDNCRKYNIQSLGNLIDSFVAFGTGFGQLHLLNRDERFDAGTDLCYMAAQEQEQELFDGTGNKLSKVDHFKWIELEFISDPYPIIKTGDSYSVAKAGEVTQLYGYLIDLTLAQGSTKRLYISPDGKFNMVDAGAAEETADIVENTIYNTYIKGQNLFTIAYDLYKDDLSLSEEIKQEMAIKEAEEILNNLDIYEDLYITKINLVNNDNVIMNYQCSIKSVYTDSILQYRSYDYQYGQLFETFEPVSRNKSIQPSTTVMDIINDKYTIQDYNSSNTLTSRVTVGAFGPIKIEAPSNTIVMLQTRYGYGDSFKEDKCYPHLIGPTGVLELHDKNIYSSDLTFLDMYFAGKHFYFKPNIDKLNSNNFWNLLNNIDDNLSDEDKFTIQKLREYDHLGNIIDADSAYDMTSNTDTGCGRYLQVIYESIDQDLQAKKLTVHGKVLLMENNNIIRSINIVHDVEDIRNLTETEKILEVIHGCKDQLPEYFNGLENQVYECHNVGLGTLYFIDYHNYFYPFEFCDNENRFSQGGDGLIPVPVLLDYYVALDSRYYGEESKKEKETTIETSNATSNSFLDNIPMK